MKLRFGFVAMSLQLEKASPSQTMTVKNFLKLPDREAALKRITAIAHSNLTNTLRILRHAHSNGVYIYRFTSKLIPLYGHELTKEWDFYRYLEKDFIEIGDFVKEKEMRVSFHPDHFTLINSPDPEIVERSMEDLERHVKMLEAMGLDERAKLVIHIGGGYKDKPSALKRFMENWNRLSDNVKRRLTVENDDKIFTACETLKVCQELKIPMVLDIHHHWCNNNDQNIEALIEPIFSTWDNTGLPPKIHVSSPKGEKDKRSHADHVNPLDVINFLKLAKQATENLDIMVEAKRKDEALFNLVQELAAYPELRRESTDMVLLYS